MPSSKRRLLRTLITASPCRGCGCDKSDLSYVHERSTPIAEHEDFTSAVISEAEADHYEMTRGSFSEKNTVHQGNKLLIHSIAVEKDSQDPYKDFRISMLQMIFENEIYVEAELQELLACFLALNSPCHHEVILNAFSQICQEAFPERECRLARNQIVHHP